MYPKIVDSVSPQSGLLSWAHYRVLIQVEDSEARKCIKEENSYKESDLKQCIIDNLQKF